MVYAVRVCVIMACANQCVHSCLFFSTQALSRMGGLWRKSHTVWVNVGGLHAGVFVLRRTAALFGTNPEDVREPYMGCESQEVNMEEEGQSASTE